VDRRGRAGRGPVGCLAERVPDLRAQRVARDGWTSATSIAAPRAVSTISTQRGRNRPICATSISSERRHHGRTAGVRVGRKVDPR
jgi:hypothetical protein